MDGYRADLHTHTYYSDGRQSPAELITEAANNGVGLIAVTDHDTMLGCEEGHKLAAAAGLKYVYGAEISAYRGNVKLHTLAYGVDAEKFSGFLDILFENSIKRTKEILHKLKSVGVNISFEEVAAERFSDLSPVHGMHIARAGSKKGYAPDAYAFYGQYLAPGKAGFDCSFRPSPEETCEAVKAAGGFSVLAHPGRIDLGREELEKLISGLKDCSLGGIEVYYTTHTEIQTAYFKRLAERLSLIPTGGSDTHYNGGTRKIGSPVFYARGELLERLKVEG